MVSCSQVLFEHCVSVFLQSLQSDVLLLSCMPLPSSGSLLLVPISMARRGWGIVDPVEDDECHASNHDKETTAQKDGCLEMEDIILYQLNCLFYKEILNWPLSRITSINSINPFANVCDLRLIVMYCIFSYGILHICTSVNPKRLFLPQSSGQTSLTLSWPVWCRKQRAE